MFQSETWPKSALPADVERSETGEWGHQATFTIVFMYTYPYLIATYDVKINKTVTGIAMLVSYLEPSWTIYSQNTTTQKVI